MIHASARQRGDGGEPVGKTRNESATSAGEKALTNHPLVQAVQVRPGRFPACVTYASSAALSAARIAKAQNIQPMALRGSLDARIAPVTPKTSPSTALRGTTRRSASPEMASPTAANPSAAAIPSTTHGSRFIVRVSSGRSRPLQHHRQPTPRTEGEQGLWYHRGVGGGSVGRCHPASRAWRRNSVSRGDLDAPRSPIADSTGNTSSAALRDRSHVYEIIPPCTPTRRRGA